MYLRYTHQAINRDDWVVCVRFVREYPRDPHVSTFKKAIQDMDSPRSVLEKGEKMSGGGGGGSAKGEEGREKPPAKRRKRGKARAGDTGEEL